MLPKKYYPHVAHILTLSLVSIMRLQRGRPTIASVLVIMMIILALAPRSLARVIFVDNQMSADCIGTYSIVNRDNSGSDGDAYNTPEEAANAATAGDTVYFRGGTYTQNARIIISGKTGTGPTAKITFTNYNSEEVIIDGTNIASVTYTGLITISNSDHIVVHGLRLTNYARKGIVYSHSDYGEVSNLTLDNMGEEGMWIFYSDHVDTTDVNAYDNGSRGIYSQLSDYTSITYCVAHGNGSHGIYLRGSSYCTIDRNEAYNDLIGIYTRYEDQPETQALYNTLSNNLCYNNTADQEDSDGIVASSGSSYATLDGNVVYGNADDGLDVSTGQGAAGAAVNNYNTITNNIVFDNGKGGDGNGIKVSTNTGGGHLIGNNIVFDNPRGGFDQDKEVGYAANYFYNNTSYNNAGGGFIMDAPSLPANEDAILYNNIAYGNSIKDLRRTDDNAVQDSDYNLWGDGDFVSGMDAHSLSGNPLFNNPNLVVDTNFGIGWSIDEKLEYIRSQVRDKFSLQSGSPAIDAGKIIVGYHNPNPGDASENGQVWGGIAPDINSYEYVDPNNPTPVLQAIGDKSVNENSALIFNINATDSDSEPIIYSAQSLPSGATFSIQTFSWTPNYAQAGSYQVKFIASDGNSNDSEIITITVYPYNFDPNDLPPVIQTIGNKTVDENSTLTFTINATDNDPITYSAQGLPSGATLDPQTGDFVWTPSYSQAGIYSVTFSASDGNSNDSETITITVNNVNRAPVLGAISDQSVNENSLLSFSVNATDPDGQTLTYSVNGLPNGAIFISQTFTWTPSYDRAGTFALTFTVDDGQAQDSQAITITVVNVNRAPILADINNRSAWAGNTLTFTIDATDPDGDAVTYSANAIPSGATFINQDFNWTPTVAQIGTYNVTFYASDGQLQDSEAITISVNVDNMAPTVTNLSPADGAIQVPLNNLIILNVTDAGKGIDPASVKIKIRTNSNPNNTTIYFGDIDHDNTLLGDCRRIGNNADYKFIFQPTQDLFYYDQTITVTVDAADLVGNVMNTFVYSFATEMHLFGQNKQVSVNLENNDRPVTVCDSNGNIWAAWHTGTAGSRDIYIGSLAAGADNFGNILQLTNDVTDQCNPAVALDSNDKLYVVWQDNRQGDWDIYISTSVDGINWSIETRVNDPNNGNQINPAIVIDSQSPNYAHVVWQDDHAGNQDICIATSSDGFTTKTISQITSDTSDQIEPAIAADSADTIYVVWTDNRNGPSDIYGAASNNGPWINVTIVSNVNNQSNPVIAAESTGSILHLLWIDDTPGNNDIYYASLNNGLPGNPIVGSSIIDDTSGTDQLEPTIAIAGATSTNDLKVFACWQDWRNTDTDLYFTELNTGSGTNVFVNDGGSNAYQDKPAIGIDEDDNPYLIWADDRNKSTDIYYTGSTCLESVALASASVNASALSNTIVGVDPQAITNLNDVSIVIPPGSCSYDVDISIAEISNQQVFSAPCLGSYEFGPSGIKFNQPVTITIPYAYSASNGTTVPYWFNSLTGTLSQQGITNIRDTVISPTLRAISFETTHLTPFYLLGGSGSIADTLGGGGGGGGGGCSISAGNEGNIIEFTLPYILLTIVMIIIKIWDTRVYIK